MGLKGLIKDNNTLEVKFHSVRAIQVAIDEGAVFKSITNPHILVEFIYEDNKNSGYMQITLERPAYSEMGYHEGYETATFRARCMTRPQIVTNTVNTTDFPTHATKAYGVFSDIDHWMVNLDSIVLVDKSSPEENAGYCEPGEDFWYDELAHTFTNILDQVLMGGAYQYRFVPANPDKTLCRKWVMGKNPSFIHDLDNPEPIHEINDILDWKSE